jgi:tetratricopeptide (TPR) repeat protein
LDFFLLLADNYEIKNGFDSVVSFCEAEKRHLLQKNLSTKSIVFFEACNTVGVKYLKSNKLKDAMLNFRAAERFCLSFYAQENDNHALLYHNIGRCYMLQKDYVNAKTYLTKSKELQVRLYGTPIPIERTELYLQEVESLLK